jgi:hypothetical protein
VAVNAGADEVAAFRVNVVSDHGRFIGSTVSSEIAFEAVTTDVADTTPRAVTVHASGGWLFAPFAHMGTHRYACVKLYRRGYRTVVLEPWTNGEAVAWVPAETAEERFQAVRDLLYATPWRSAPVRLDHSEPEDLYDQRHVGTLHPTMGWAKGNEAPFQCHWRLRPGSWSDAHRKGLEFAHDECEKLLDDPAADDKLKARIRYLMVRLDEVIER